MHDIFIFTLLFGSGIMAGICNATAGGGTFFTFPVFLAAGLPPIVANASNAIAVWPGHALAVVAYRHELRTHPHGLRLSLLLGLLGGIIGAMLLVWIQNSVFLKLIPVLILFATLLFAFSDVIRGWLAKNPQDNQSLTRRGFAHVFELVIAIYGGFFIAGLGIMLMAGLQMLGVRDIQMNNALKNLLAAVISSVAALVFIFSGLVHWQYTLIAFIGAVIGGYWGGRIARWLPALWLRRIVIALGLGLSIFYALKYYG